jgi:hypothetical protein
MMLITLIDYADYWIDSLALFLYVFKEPLIKSFFKIVIARNPGGVTKQSLEIKLNLHGLLRHPSGVPRNDVKRKT